MLTCYPHIKQKHLENQGFDINHLKTNQTCVTSQSCPKELLSRYWQQVVVEAHAHIIHGPFDWEFFPADIPLKGNSKVVTSISKSTFMIVFCSSNLTALRPDKVRTSIIIPDRVKILTRSSESQGYILRRRTHRDDSSKKRCPLAPNKNGTHLKGIGAGKH